MPPTPHHLPRSFSDKHHPRTVYLGTHQNASASVGQNALVLTTATAGCTKTRGHPPPATTCQAPPGRPRLGKRRTNQHHRPRDWGLAAPTNPLVKRIAAGPPTIRSERPHRMEIPPPLSTPGQDRHQKPPPTTQRTPLARRRSDGRKGPGWKGNQPTRSLQSGQRRAVGSAASVRDFPANESGSP